MKMNSNVDSWLSNAPEDVTRTTQELLQKVKQMRDEQVIYPPQEDILNALAWTPPQDVRVVILGQDPYHGPGQAMGLSFSVHRDQRLPPSLRNIYKELVADLGCDTPATGDLSNWARQGVLLLNTTLTVREHAANSHSKLGWQTLTDYVVRRCCELSGGEVQMVLIARALSSQPGVLVLDEPESNLDFKNQLLVLDTIEDLAKSGLTCIFNTHFPAHALRRASQALLLGRGGKSVCGKTCEVVTEDRISEFFGVRAVIGEMQTPLGIYQDVIPVSIGCGE